MFQRLKEIRQEISEKRTAIENSEDQNEIQTLGNEIETLENEQEEVIQQLENEENTRKALEEEEKRNLQKEPKKLDPIATYQIRKEEKNMENELNKENVLKSKSYRSAWAKTMLCRNDLTEEEKRALNVALTTTATEFVAPTADADGVNNGGLFIPEEVSLEILKQIELESPFLADTAKTFFKGNVKFPYKKTSSGASWKEENEKNGDASQEYGQLELTSKELSETITITWKLESMAVESFISYIITEIAREMTETLAVSNIYGTGVKDITGATNNAIQVTYDGTTKTVMDSIKEGITKLPVRKAIGAVIYIARDIETEILFQKDENGSYQNNPVLLNGISKIGSYTVKVDPFLHDGEFLIGNATKNQKMNFSEQFSLTKDVSGKCRINDYTGYTVVAAAPVPNSFVYGKKAA